MLEQTARNLRGAQVYDSDWRRVRREHLAMEPACRRCGTTLRLEVHHAQRVADRPDLRLAHANLVTLCKACHPKEEESRKGPR